MNAWQMAGPGLFAAVLVAAAISDIRHNRIPNLISGGLVVLLVIHRLALVQGEALVWGLAAGLAALAVGILLYARGIWGGGDAKLLAAVVAWVGLGELTRLLLVTTLTGGVLAVAMLLARRWRRPDGEPPTDLPMPYGVAIAAGGLDWAFSQILR